MSENHTPPLTSDVLLVLTINAAELRGDELTIEVEQGFAAAVDRSGATRIVVNMEAVTYLTSTGVRVLLTLYQKVKGSQGRVVLCGLTDMVSDVLQVMRFIDPTGERPAPFETQPDVTAGVISLLSGRAPRG
jgi:anti-anti-sigma factor